MTQELVREPQEKTSHALGMPAMPTEISARREKPGMLLSQAGSGGHSKGDGQGSHTLPGITQ